MSKHTLYRRCLAAICLLCMGTLLTGCPKKEEVVEDTGPVYTPEQQQKIEEARAYAKKRYDEELAKEAPFDRIGILSKFLLERYRINLNTLFPDGYTPDQLKSPTELSVIIAERAEEDTNERYSATLLQETRRLAEIEHPLFKLGDTIKLKTKRGSVLEGKITALSDQSVSVDGTEIVLTDVVEPDVGSLIPERNEKQKELYIRRHFKIARQDYHKTRAKQLIPIVYKEFAYVRADGKWQRIDEFIEVNLKAEIDKMEAEFNAELDKAIRNRIQFEMEEKGMLSLETHPVEEEATPETE